MNIMGTESSQESLASVFKTHSTKNRAIIAKGLNTFKQEQKHFGISKCTFTYCIYVSCPFLSTGRSKGHWIFQDDIHQHHNHWQAH